MSLTKCRPIADVERLVPTDAQIGFVNERGGLQGVVGPFAAHHAPGDSPQLVVDGFHDLIRPRANRRGATPGAAD